MPDRGGNAMESTTLYFNAPGRVELRHEQLPALSNGQVLVETLLTGISAGTEMLVYRGQFPRELADTNDTVSANLQYPLSYGYACVGRVAALGKGVDKSWADQLVFAFQTHRSRFVAGVESLQRVPNGVSAENAIFLPNMETAVNLIQDAEPMLGECVLVLGQGIVGLLATALLRQFPVQSLVTADRYQLRRTTSLALGVDACLDPTFEDFCDQAKASARSLVDGYDLILELSGNPAALNDAIALTAYSGRIVVGSWYGEKRAPLDLGGRFHRSRIQLISSQVSSISPRLNGRWSKARRFDVAWDALRRIGPEKWITQRIPIREAAEAYRILDESPENTLQVVLEYA
jgi:2-desacetyl-2-hydroxyethyl bacteriochlorophyllide A dehydrogenase